MSHDWNDVGKSGKSTPSNAFQSIAYTALLKLDEFTTSIDIVNLVLRVSMLIVNSLSGSRTFAYILCVFSKKRQKCKCVGHLSSLGHRTEVIID